MLVLGNKTKRSRGSFFYWIHKEKTNKSLSNSEWGCRQKKSQRNTKSAGFSFRMSVSSEKTWKKSEDLIIKHVCFSYCLDYKFASWSVLVITQHGLERWQQTNLRTLKNKNKLLNKIPFLPFTRSYFPPQQQFLWHISALSLLLLWPSLTNFALGWI